MTPRKKDQIRKDLTRHLRTKVLHNVSDYIDLCRDSGVSQRDCVSELMVFFAHFTAAFAANQFKIDANEFGRTMVMQFQRAQAEEESES